MADQNANQGGSQDAAGGGQQSGSQGRTFTQEEVNAFVAERAKHAKSSALADLLKDLGVEKVEDLKGAMTEYRKLKESSMTETQRLQERLAALEREQANWQRERQELTVKQAVSAAAAKAGALYPESAYKLIDLAALDYDDDGQPKNLEAVLKQLRTQYPVLFRPAGGGADGGAGSKQTASGKSMNQFIRAAAGRQ